LDDFALGTTALTVQSLVYLTREGYLHDKPVSGSVQLTLAGTEIALPILVRDTTTGEESFIPHVAWSVSTGA
ncbi:hypothetical protein ACWELQ_38435, partial [Nocardia sp. NPDC004722]